MSTNIAAGCEQKPFNHSYDCGVKINRVDTLFNDDFASGVCTIRITDGQNQYNNLCYHNPSPGNNVFIS